MLGRRNTFRNAYKKEPKKTKQTKWFSGFDLNFDSASTLKLLPYLIYVAFFGVIYIANRHYTEKNIRKVSKLRKEVEILRVDYTSLKSLYMNSTKYSEVVRKAKKLRLNESKVPNTKINTSAQ